MKIASIKDFLLNNRKLVIGIVLICILAGGGYFAYTKYTFSKSPENFVIELNTALATANMPELAKKINFRTLTEDIASEILNMNLPLSIAIQEKNQTILAENMQKFFLDALTGKDSSTQAPPVRQDPLRPYELIPDDFLTQLAGNIVLHGQREDTAFLRAQLHYPRMKKDITIFFLLEKNPEWQLVRITNLADILRTFTTAENQLSDQREQRFLKEKQANEERINAQFTLNSCTAFLFKPSGQQEPTLRVNLTGHNNGPFIIRNMTFKVAISGKTAKAPIRIEKDLSNAARINPAVTMEDSYTIELKADDAIESAFMQATDVACTAKVHFMTLDNGELLYTHTKDRPKNKQ